MDARLQAYKHWGASKAGGICVHMRAISGRERRRIENRACVVLSHFQQSRVVQPDVLLNLLLLLHTVPVSTRGPRLVMLTRMPLSQVAPWSSPVCVCVWCVCVCVCQCVSVLLRLFVCLFLNFMPQSTVCVYVLP